jgi:cation diffusion facilitator CzcD-associated flavoprotein CzcO
MAAAVRPDIPAGPGPGAPGGGATEPAARTRFYAIVVGAGFAGICTAIRLKQAGIDDFVVLERESGVGGTWRDNRYPGAACDVESHLYSFSFEPNPEWTRQFAPGAEILEYLQRCADKYGVTPHVRFGRGVVRAVFDERRNVWAVTTSSGETLFARLLVSACGGLSRPAVPDIPGLASFEGGMCHSARWDDRIAIDGAALAVVGTGASAIQIVPAVAPRAARVYVLQRTPPWIMPKLDRAIRVEERARYRRRPLLQRLARIVQYWQHEVSAVAFIAAPWLFVHVGARLARAYLERSVKDPALRAKLSPAYTMGCKRILPTNDWYPALQRENVELVTDPIRAVTPRGIQLETGVELRVDSIVLATGFQAAENVAPFEVHGRDGRRLDQVWRDGAEAYLGTAIAGFPNFFMLIGPNTGLGHTSMILMIESQVQYVVDAARTMRARHLGSVDVRADVQARYNASLQARLGRTVWASGCRSWYLTPSGRNTTLWPGFTFEFRFRTRRFDPGDYRTTIDAAPARSLA